MANNKSLKEQNGWLIHMVLLIHFLVFAYAGLKPIEIGQLTNFGEWDQYQGLFKPGVMLVAALALSRLVVLGLIPAIIRDRLIHWRWENPLPGSRAFSKHGPSDPRVDMQVIAERYDPLPTAFGQQDNLFYKIYRAHKDEVGVLDAHRSYLAARDIGIINFVMLVLLPPLLLWFTTDTCLTGIYTGALFMAYAVFALVAQRFGVRLVQNTLACESASD